MNEEPVSDDGLRCGGGGMLLAAAAALLLLRCCCCCCLLLLLLPCETVTAPLSLPAVFFLAQPPPSARRFCLICIEVWSLALRALALRRGARANASAGCCCAAYQPRQLAHASVLQLRLPHPLDVLRRREAPRVEALVADHALEMGRRLLPGQSARLGHHLDARAGAGRQAGIPKGGRVEGQLRAEEAIERRHRPWSESGRRARLAPFRRPDRPAIRGACISHH